LSQKYTKQIAAIFLGETSRVTDAFLDLFSGLEPTLASIDAICEFESNEVSCRNSELWKVKSSQARK
jgi:hypothetical protein